MGGSRSQTLNTTLPAKVQTYGLKTQNLNLRLVPQTIYEMQTSFYPLVANEYGVPLDSRHTVESEFCTFFSVSFEIYADLWLG